MPNAECVISERNAFPRGVLQSAANLLINMIAGGNHTATIRWPEGPDEECGRKSWFLASFPDFFLSRHIAIPHPSASLTPSPRERVLGAQSATMLDLDGPILLICAV